MTEINPEHLATRIAQFRDERRALQEMVMKCFPIGSKVRLIDTKQIGHVHTTCPGYPDLLVIHYRDELTGAMRGPVVSVDNLERFDEPY